MRCRTGSNRRWMRAAGRGIPGMADVGWGEGEEGGREGGKPKPPGHLLGMGVWGL